MTNDRPLGHPAAGTAPGVSRGRYQGTPIPSDWYADGPDAFRIKKAPPKPPPEASVAPWDKHAAEVAYSLTLIEVDAVRVDVDLRSTAPKRVLTLRLEYVGSITDARIWLSCHVAGKALRQRLMTGPTPPDGALIPPWTFPLVNPKKAGIPSVLLWRSREAPIVSARLAIELVRDVLGVSNPSRVHVRREESDGATAIARTHRTVSVSRRKSNDDEVLGYCSECNRPLRTPEYAAIGLGPECIKKFRAAELRLRRELNTAVSSGHELRPNAKSPTDWLASVSKGWGLQ